MTPDIINRVRTFFTQAVVDQQVDHWV